MLISDTTSKGLGAPSARRFYKPELDILRFFAFLAVFVFHTVNYSTGFLVQHHIPLWAAKIGLSFAGAGTYGVDVFFVLSSYLITELLLREKATTGSLDVKAFYLRRILRIWPLYYLFLALAVFVPLLNPQHEFSLKYVIPFAALMGNWSLVVFRRAEFGRDAVMERVGRRAILFILAAISGPAVAPADRLGRSRDGRLGECLASFWRRRCTKPRGSYGRTRLPIWTPSRPAY